MQEQNFPGVSQSPTQSITLLVKRKRGFKHNSKIFYFKYRKGLNELFVTTPILRESCYFSKAAFDKSEAKASSRVNKSALGSTSVSVAKPEVKL